MKSLLIISALSIIYYLVLKWSHHMVAFSKFFLFFGLMGITVSLFELYSPFSLFFWIPSPLQYLIKMIILLFVLGFVLFLICSFYKNKKSVLEAPDVIFVFGAGLFGDKPSLSLLTRLQKAVELADKYENAEIIVSGGQGKDEWISEAMAMKKYLISQNITSSRIIMEDQSTSTYENLAYAKDIYAFKNKKVALVSNTFHIFRLEKIAKKMDIDGYGVGAPLNSIASWGFYVREYFALIKGFIFHEI